MVISDNKNDKLGNLVWSFSKVNTYNHCPHGFKLTYIDEKPKIDNAFAEYGSFVHSLLERYFNGEIEFFELSQMYENEYNINVLTQGISQVNIQCYQEILLFPSSPKSLC